MSSPFIGARPYWSGCRMVYPGTCRCVHLLSIFLICGVSPWDFLGKSLWNASWLCPTSALYPLRRKRGMRLSCRHMGWLMSGLSRCRSSSLDDIASGFTRTCVTSRFPEFKAGQQDGETDACRLLSCRFPYRGKFCCCPYLPRLFSR